MRVLIVGAGIGGLTAAIALRRKGIGVEIEASLRRYESQRIPRTRFITTMSRRVGQAFQLESRVLCRLRDLGMRPMPASIV